MVGEWDVKEGCAVWIYMRLGVFCLDGGWASVEADPMQLVSMMREGEIGGTGVVYVPC